MTDRADQPDRGDIDRDWRWTLFGFYLQDNFQVTPTLTLNAGLRYEFTTMPVDEGGPASTVMLGSTALMRG